MAVSFSIEQFEGPLDLLLQLVEQEKLNISDVSLATVAEQFVAHVESNPAIPPEELADFLVVAAKLMYMKSKLLVPSLHDAELEEGPDLETQLREYQRFVAASRGIAARWDSSERSFSRVERRVHIRPDTFVPPHGVTADVLHHVMRLVISRLEPILRLPKASIERAVTIQEKIRDLYERLKRHARTSFRSFVTGVGDRTEVIVSFLALLELVKQRFIHVDQSDRFTDIKIRRHPDAPKSNPVAAEI
ncbi:segregation/condensation protein A [Candidatus Uhrbacteria bacterium]|nr:segregation/condensation protein A [Candidatus Uhrbacteria bacterium]